MTWVTLCLNNLFCRSPKHSTPMVKIQRCSDRHYWLVNIECKDRNKLLFDTVCTLADMNYDVYHASIDSVKGKALQEYYIRTRYGCTGKRHAITVATFTLYHSMQCSNSSASNIAGPHLLWPFIPYWRYWRASCRASPKTELALTFFNCLLTHLYRDTELNHDRRSLASFLMNNLCEQVWCFMLTCVAGCQSWVIH